MALHYRRLATKVVAAVFTATVISTGHGLVHPQTAAAYCKIGSKWESNIWNLHVLHYVPSAWNNALSASSSQWNNTSKLQYHIVFGSTQWWNFNLDNLDFSYWGYQDVPGLTQFKGRDDPGSGWKWNPHNRADVRLNSSYTWNTSGVMNLPQRKVDVRTIATHEIGHATGLDHPDPLAGVCPPPFTLTEQQSVMNPDGTKKWTTNADDDAGNKALYGVP